jgi:hypothetical protein
VTVARFVQPNYTTQAAAAYKANIDAAFAVNRRIAGAFAPHQVYSGSPQPDLAVELDAGYVWSGTTMLEVAAQSVSGFTIPTAGQHRIDRVVVNVLTGVATRVAGTAVTGSPTATPPAIPTGTLPVCQVLITSADTTITDSMITDERVPLGEAGRGQITFPAAQNASTDANTLDDYEEGTWTPSVGGTATYITQVGQYTKIGRVVYVRLSMQIDAIGSGSTSDIGGLPFTSLNVQGTPLATHWLNASATNVVYMSIYVKNGSTNLGTISATAAQAALAVNAIYQAFTSVEAAGVYHTS